MNATERHSIIPGNNFLTLDRVREIAPSIFADHPWEGVTPKYSFIPTFKVLDSLLSEGWQMTKVQQQRTRIEGKQFFTKHLIRLRRDGEIAVNDVFPEIILINSHDRGSAYQMIAALFRKVCSNGLVVSDSTLKKISIRHSGNIIDDVRYSADAIAGDAPKIINEVKTMKEIELTPNEMGVFAQAAKLLRYDKEMPLESARLLERKRSEDNASNLWTTFNKVQENLLNGGQHYISPAFRDETGKYHSKRFKKTRKVNSIQEDTKLNRALWTLTMEMKKIKAN